MTMVERTCDLLVVGSGASGLATAVTAAHLGLDVVVIEKESQFGGTSAWSGGWLWIPRNPLAERAGIKEESEAPRTYLRSELGDGYNDAFATMLLEQGPRMISFFEKETELAFIDGNTIPDFHDRSAGAGFGGRSVCAAPYDGRRLGKRIKDLKAPLDLIAPFGMGIASGADLRHFLNAMRKLPSFLHVVRRILTHFKDRLCHGRGMHLVNGNALIARLLKSADNSGVTLLARTQAKELLVENGGVTGLKAQQDGTTIVIHARRGVVLAAGGFPHDPVRKAAMFPHDPTGLRHFSAAPFSNTGDGLRIGEAIGGVIPQDLAHNGAWAPVSLVPRDDGSVGHFPHLIERAKPGLIMVLPTGKRFTNEADSYHDVMKALFEAQPENPECWMICDQTFLNRYGLGRVRPLPFQPGPWIGNGYLKYGKTIAELARRCAIPEEALTATVHEYNRFAAEGKDPAFGRGSSAYNRIQGDAENTPNPCVAPIEKPGFYAVRIVPGSLGSFAGLRTDETARVLRADRTPIAGLYAVGNDMSSMMAGRYPAGGITLGPGMTFGYVAAHHASGIPLSNNKS